MFFEMGFGVTDRHKTYPAQENPLEAPFPQLPAPGFEIKPGELNSRLTDAFSHF